MVAKASNAGEGNFGVFRFFQKFNDFNVDNFMWMRTNIPRLDENPIPVEERGTDKETELAIAKKYQVFRANFCTSNI